MVLSRAQVKKIVAELIERLEKQSIPVERVYLFGSYARANPRPTSDLDFAIVSSRFKRWSDIRRIEILSDVARHPFRSSHLDIDVVGFTQEEMEKASYFDLAAEILEKGRLIYKKAA